MSNALKNFSSDLSELVKEEKDISPPKRYMVILLNDDITTMDFVVSILIDIFYYELESAINKMLQVHNEGKAVCGVYSYDIATTLQQKVIFVSKTNDYPLKCIVEECK